MASRLDQVSPLLDPLVATPMSRGLQRERDLVTLLREAGWWAIRSPASKGDVDVVAVRYLGHKQRRDGAAGPIATVRFIEVKSTARSPFHSFGPADRKELSEAARMAGASAELCWWPPRKQPMFIPESEWPGSGGRGKMAA